MKKVFVGMSGGVDSSTTAALLKKKGYEVSGVFIRGYYPPGIPCTWREDRRDAMRVAALLDIPFYTFDFSKEYKKHIIDYMVKEYKEGRTPNPDIMCNKYIKFDMFLKKALEMGADKIATGHYTRLRREIRNSKFEIRNLHISKDKNKDQSYFLWTLTQKQLKHCLFPLGKYIKDEVRVMAKKFKLPTANKKDSQGLCFVGEFKMEDFLKDYIKLKSGDIIDETGKVIGKHNGVQYYTIGQRHGMGATGREPYYIVEKDIKKNILKVATQKQQKDFAKKEIEIKDVNWVSGTLPDTSKKYLGRIRYRQPLQKCKISHSTQNKRSLKLCTIEFEQAQTAVASGQSLVLYDLSSEALPDRQAGLAKEGKNTMLGGGIIV